MQGIVGPGPEQDTENVVRDYASVEKWEKNLRATQQEGSHAQYQKPSQLPRAGEVMDLREEICLFLKIEAKPLSQVNYRNPGDQCFFFTACS